MKSKLLLIIPAYNEEKNISRVVDNIITNYPKWDYVVINDGSSDDTRHICLEKKYNFIDYPINQGLTSAFRGGIYYALYNDYEFVMQYDGDGQHDPEYIDQMLKFAIDNNVDVVIGSRFLKSRKPFSARMIGSRIIGLCIFITTQMKINDPTSGMRIFSNRAMKYIYSKRTFGPEPDTIAHLLRSKMRVIEFPIEMKDRIGGTSYLNLTNSIKYMLHMCFSILVVERLRRKG